MFQLQRKFTLGVVESMVSSKEILFCEKLCLELPGFAKKRDAVSSMLIFADYIYSIPLALINDGLMQLRSQSSFAHRANRPADKCGTNATVNLLFYFFIGRLGLGNEDDCAAPQKVT